MQGDMITIHVSNSYSIKKAIEQRMVSVRRAIKSAKFSMQLMVDKAKDVAEVAKKYKQEKTEQKRINDKFIATAHEGGNIIGETLKNETEQAIDIKNKANITDAGFKNTNKLKKLKNELDDADKNKNRDQNKTISL